MYPSNKDDHGMYKYCLGFSDYLGLNMVCTYCQSFVIELVPCTPTVLPHCWPIWVFGCTTQIPLGYQIKEKAKTTHRSFLIVWLCDLSNMISVPFACIGSSPLEEIAVRAYRDKSSAVHAVEGQSTCGNAPIAPACLQCSAASLQIGGYIVSCFFLRHHNIATDPTLGSPPHMRENRREAKTTTTTSERRLRQQRLATRSNICVERSCAAKNQDTSASTLQTNQERMVNPPANVHEDRAKATRPGASSTKRAKRQRSVTEPTISVGESSAATNEDTSASALQTNQECMVNPPADVHADRAKATRPGTSSTKRAKRQRSVTKPAISVGESSAATDEEQPSNAVTHVHENHPKATRSGGTSTRRVRKHQSTSRSTFCVGESSGNTNQSASPVYEDLGDCTYTCRYCKAAFWYGERIKGNHSYSRQPQYHLCCKDGKVLMQPEPDPPEYIKNLLGDPNFIHNVRAYNQMFGMTSFGATIDSTINRGRGPYVFKVSGQIYHYIGSLCPTGDDDPCFLQLYVYDTQNEVQNRMNHFKVSQVTYKMQMHQKHGQASSHEPFKHTLNPCTHKPLAPKTPHLCHYLPAHSQVQTRPLHMLVSSPIPPHQSTTPNIDQWLKISPLAPSKDQWL
ncbi:hypothetical protein CTI12_AA345630 [Artemisia annua]|uniref:Helitron helicase-like domain-containing protein n=1 Tax=Artemisia annua TaxID=35608 RepID=A0A2U1MST2_ARTAN|nr:hypothetical protein CTI12_AA345630 [Artemisia annua]